MSPVIAGLLLSPLLIWATARPLVSPAGR